MRYHPKTHRIYVVHADRELSVIQAEDYAIGSPIELAKSLGAFKVDKSRPRMYMNVKGEGLVLAIDAEKGQVVGKFPVAPGGVNASLAIDATPR